MPKSTITFVCTECGGESLRWAGQCPHCRAWNTLQEFQVRTATKESKSRPLEAARVVRLSEIPTEDAARTPLAWAELNRMLGGGIVPGSLVLVGGEPGVGKSTMLMHAAAQIAKAGNVLYVTGEESGHQVRMRAERLGALEPAILLLAENDLDAICDAIRNEAPRLAIIDSIQTVTDAGFEGSAGSVTQVRESAARLMRLAKETGVPVFLVGHVTKEGSIAGPRVLEHIVDTVLYLEGDRRQELRILRATKNRFGSSEEIGVFAMGETGLEEVPDPSAAILATAGPAAPGSVIVSVLEGTRPLLGEVRRVGHLERRLQEAARHGLTRALIPAEAKTGRPSGLDVVEVRSLAEAVSAAFSSPIQSGAFIKEAGISVS